MKEAKHTPGPWIIQSHEINELLYYVVPSRDEGRIIAGPYQVPLPLVKGNFGTDETRANARLIAAAPELLNAVQRLIACFGSMGEPEHDAFWENHADDEAPQSGDEIQEQELLQARAAIAKATGA